jgi:ankyrin repeat protein
MDFIDECRDGDFSAVRSLVSSGASVNFQRHNGMTPVVCCCMYGHPEILQYLLEHGANADHTWCGWAPLQCSIMRNQQGCVTVLLAHGVAVDDTVHFSGYTALWLASCHGYLSIVQVLVRGGADPERAAGHGRTPIHIARRRGRTEVVKYLEIESKWRRRRAWATVFDSIKNVDSNAGIFRVMQNRDLAGVIASYF